MSPPSPVQRSTERAMFVPETRSAAAVVGSELPSAPDNHSDGASHNSRNSSLPGRFGGGRKQRNPPQNPRSTRSRPGGSTRRGPSARRTAHLPPMTSRIISSRQRSVPLRAVAGSSFSRRKAELFRVVNKLCRSVDSSCGTRQVQGAGWSRRASDYRSGHVLILAQGALFYSGKRPLMHFLVDIHSEDRVLRQSGREPVER
jgi:hypothetical protein